MKYGVVLIMLATCFGALALRRPCLPIEAVVAHGHMPSLAVDSHQRLHLVYGSGDSLLYQASADGGHTFSSPMLIAVVPHLAASHTRGPQVAATTAGVLVTACTEEGAILSFQQAATRHWRRTARVTDTDTTAKENLMALAADGPLAVAVWLDARGDGHNKIYGARSTDGGKTWGTNQLIYASPEGTVCECCRPSVAVKGKTVVVQFRNWLQGNRDLYLVQSANGGKTFGPAQKLGIGTWPLKGCPMDGGGLVLNTHKQPQTAWNRNGTLYACAPGQPEQALGAGRSITVAAAEKNVYAWVQDGIVVFRNLDGALVKLGLGQLPVLTVLNAHTMVCVWEQEGAIHRALLPV